MRFSTSTLWLALQPRSFDPLGNNLAWIIAYSGVSRELTKSGFNVRVAECCEAAAILKSGAQKLGDVPQDIFEMGKAELPPNLCRRAEHFFSEMERVRAGKQAWAECDATRSAS